MFSRSRRLVSLEMFLVCGATCVSIASAAPTHTVHVRVEVPPSSAADLSVYLAGSAASLGSWKADGLRLTRDPEGRFSGDVILDEGESVEFKFTRGDWQTVEKNADGTERANRTADPLTTQIEAKVERWSDAQATSKPASTVVGTLVMHQIPSSALATTRTIRVWLPPGYDADAQAHFDVLYLQDGQNLFDVATAGFGHEWQIDETLTRLIVDKAIRPIVVVGIDNGGADRIKELTYTADEKARGGAAVTYAKFLLEDVKPFIEKTYRVETGPAHTFVGGSSLGGLFALDVARRNPGVFGGVLAMSPSLWWRGEPIIPAVDHDAGGLSKARVWLDMGTAEGDEGVIKKAGYVDDARRMDAALTKQNVAHHLTLEEGAKHNEDAWARRFPEAIQYLLKRE